MAGTVRVDVTTCAIPKRSSDKETAGTAMLRNEATNALKKRLFVCVGPVPPTDLLTAMTLSLAFVVDKFDRSIRHMNDSLSELQNSIVMRDDNDSPVLIDRDTR